MFKDLRVTLYIPDMIFLFVFSMLMGSLVKVFYFYDEYFGLFLIILGVISFLAYIWKFCLTSVKKEDKNLDSQKLI